MIWAILAILGDPLWLIVGALSASLWSRHRFRAQEGVFPLHMRAPGKAKWSRMLAYGRLISDVFVVNRGVALQRTTIHQVRAVRDLSIAKESSPRHMDDAVGRLLDLNDGTTVEVVFSAHEAFRFDQTI